MKRGRLRVYLGAAPGVGKTYAMLDEGRRRRKRGTDVVIGLVETHHRVKTAEAVGDLEIVPRRWVDHHGVRAGELDVEAVLARAPAVALVDELAHTNAGTQSLPGGRNKRWQDVELLLDAGIDVITTVNVQHLESLNDVVTGITGIRQQETVPDRVVRAAETVELVDMSPQSLRRRMAHGNIYPPASIDTALTRYFREGNLAALRELALLWLADRVDEGLESYRAQHGIDQTWATRERVVVGLSGGPESEAMMRRAARIASRSGGGEWLAVYVARRDGLRSVPADQLERLRHLAEDLGGSFRALVAGDVAQGLLDVARSENATQILIGASRRGRVSTLLQPGVGETVIAESGDIDVHAVTHPYARSAGRPRRRRPGVSRARVVSGYAVAVAGTAIVTAALVATPNLHGLPTETLVLLSVVVATALIGGLLPAVVAALVASLALNLFFVAPTGTLSVADPENAFAIVVFVIIGIAVATVVDRAARRSEQAARARVEANALAVLSHNLLRSGGSSTELLREACEVFGMTGAAVLQVGSPPVPAAVTEAAFGDAPTSVAASDADVTIEPGVVLVLRGRPLPTEQRRLLTAYAAHVAVIRERKRAAAQARQAQELAAGNRTRTALLAAVSHDLRSPLAAAKAAVSSLRNDEIAWSPDDEAELLATVEESVDRLDALVANLLDLSRLQTGAITPLLADLDLASMVEWVLGSVAGADRVRVQLAADLPLARADAGLLERVLANVIENALQHTPAQSPVEIVGSCWSDDQGGEQVSLRVVDHGPGVPVGRRDALFAPFQRLGDVPQGDGLGLGLAVARGLTEAMAGRLSAEETPGGGLTLVVDLPVADSPAADGPDPGDRESAG